MGSDGQSELRIVRMETQTILVKVIQDADGPMLTGYEWREYDCPHRSSAFYLGLMLVFLFQVFQGGDWIVWQVVDCKDSQMYMSCKWSSGICYLIQHNLTRTRQKTRNSPVNCCQLSGFPFPSPRFRNPIQHLNCLKHMFLSSLDIVYFHNVQIIYGCFRK